MIAIPAVDFTQLSYVLHCCATQDNWFLFIMNTNGKGKKSYCSIMCSLLHHDLAPGSIHVLITSAEEVMFSLLFVCLSVIQHNNSQTAETIAMKVCRGSAHDPRKNQLNIGVDQEKWADPGFRLQHGEIGL